MPSFNTRVAVNYIKRLSVKERRAELADLLAAFPDDWLAEALVIAHEVQRQRVANALPQRNPLGRYN